MATTEAMVEVTIPQGKLESYEKAEAAMLKNRFEAAIREAMAGYDPDDEDGVEEAAEAILAEVGPYFNSAMRQAIRLAMA